MVGGTEGGMMEVSEGLVWISLKDGPMVLNGRVSTIDRPSVRTDWGHSSPNTLQLGHAVSTFLLSAPTCSKGIAHEAEDKYKLASVRPPMAFCLFIIQDNCAIYFEFGKQIFLLAFPSSRFELRVALRELAHSMCLMSPKTSDLGECTTVQLPTSVPQVLRGLPLPKQRSQGPPLPKQCSSL